MRSVLSNRALALLVFLCVFVQLANGQARVQRSGSFWPELQTEYLLKSTSFFYFRTQLRRNFDDEFNHLREGAPWQYMERVQFRIGYEHAFNARWNAGVTEAFAIDPDRYILFNEVYARHVSRLGKVRFTKRGSLEHLYRSNQRNYPRSRFQFDLDRAFTIGHFTFRPRIAYEVFFNFSYYPDETPSSQERLVDRTRLRVEILFPINEHLSISPYIFRQSDYFSVEPAFNEHNVQIKPGGKQNHITPVLGINMRYTFFQGGTPFPRFLPL